MIKKSQKFVFEPLFKFLMIEFIISSPLICGLLLLFILILLLLLLLSSLLLFIVFFIEDISSFNSLYDSSKLVTAPMVWARSPLTSTKIFYDGNFLEFSPLLIPPISFTNLGSAASTFWAIVPTCVNSGEC